MVLVVLRLEWVLGVLPRVSRRRVEGGVTGFGWAWGCWHTVGSWDNRTGCPCERVVVPDLWSGSGRAGVLAPWGGAEVRCGLLFGNCIVDASILFFIAAIITPPGVVWWRRECSHL